MPVDSTILTRLSNSDPTLTSLGLGGNAINADEANEIAKALSTNTTLVSLYLGENLMCDAGVKALAAVLTNNTTLTSLNLSNNYLTDAGAKELMKGLASNCTLAVLGLYNNKISIEVNKQIRSLIQNNREYLKGLQRTACQQLKIGRILFYRVRLTKLPLEILEKIVSYIDENAILSQEQQRLVLNYAEGKIAPVADKLSFFKVTKCDRIIKPLVDANQSDEPQAKRARLSFDG